MPRGSSIRARPPLATWLWSRLGSPSISGKKFKNKVFREASHIGRESLGGNGIIGSNKLITALMDMEAMYTYEGTYDINTLVCGRELTGIAAFKTR